MTARQATIVQPGRPTAGGSIGAAPGQTRTVTAAEIGYELVSRCTVIFTPPGEPAPVQGRLVELVQPLPGGAPREPGMEEPATLHVAVDGSRTVFPVPTTTAVTVNVDPA